MYLPALHKKHVTIADKPDSGTDARRISKLCQRFCPSSLGIFGRASHSLIPRYEDAKPSDTRLHLRR